MTDHPYVDFDGQKAVRIRELAKDKCLLLYHDKANNVFRLGMFEVVGNEFRPLAGAPRVISDTDPLAETAKNLAKEIGEEFTGAVLVQPVPVSVVQKTAAKPRKATGRKASSAITVRKIDDF